MRLESISFRHDRWSVVTGSYGEISPYAVEEPCDLHNQTMTLATIHER